MQKLFTFGCSFSFNFWIDETETYTHLLSKKYNCQYKNTSAPALCNDEIFNRFITNVKDIAKDDIVIYQFTSGYREGFTFVNNNNFYYSSAGLQKTVEESNSILNQWGGGRNKYPFSDKQMEILIDYINNWAVHKNFHRYERVRLLMELLSNQIGFKYVFLHMDDSFDLILSNKNTISFQDENKIYYSIIEWIKKNTIRLSDFREMPFSEDSHPSPIAHKMLAEKIFDFFS